MKRTAAILLVFALIISVSAGCSGPDKHDTDEKLHIVATIFPEYDWVREIIGRDNEDVDLTLIFDTGADLHSYQPTVDDLVSISNSDIFIHVGGISDKWVDDALSNPVNKDMIVINLFDILGDRLMDTKIVEGMEHHHDHHQEEHDGDTCEESPEFRQKHKDEHVWLSVKNAKIAVSYIAEKIGEADPAHSDIYSANAAAYIKKLDELDGEYQSTVSKASADTLLFADRFPFCYLLNDYNLNYYAAFTGCSAESEASFETVAFLADKVDELGLKYVLTIENPTHKIAETVIENTETKDQTVLSMNSLQSVTEKDISEGLTYIDAMEYNLHILEEALS